MTEQTRKRAVYGLFVGAVILALFARPWERRHRELVQEEAPVAAATAAIALTAGAAASDSAVMFAESWPHDPFNRRPLPESDEAVAVPAPVTTGPNLSLQGVMVVNGARTGVINGHLVQVGGTVEGWRVVQIEPQSVRLVREGETIDLHLP